MIVSDDVDILVHLSICICNEGDRERPRWSSLSHEQDTIMQKRGEQKYMISAWLP